MPQNKVCRLCLVKPSVCFSILEGNIANMLEALTSTKVNTQDGISTIICLKCLLNLKLAYNFQQRIKKCEKKLVEKLTDRLNIKQEPQVLKVEYCDTVDEESDIKSDRDTYEDLVKLIDSKCTICGLFVEDISMNDHIREHFTNEQECSFCDRTFTDIQQYRQHLSDHSEKRLHRCNNCRATFLYKSFYDMHIQSVCSDTHAVHDRIATLGIQSKQAINVLTETKNKRRIPVALHEINNEDTRKQVFKLGLRSSKAIKVLIGDEGKDESRICNICFKKFTKKSFQCHTHETKTCHVCNREVSKYTIRKHLEDHALGPQICHVCGATLQNKSCLMAHIFYSHHDLRHKCDVCGKLFQKKHARDLHKQKEHIGQPTHYCDTCGKGFFTARFLDKHIKMRHLKLRPHICEFCQKGFSSQYALKTHRRLHTNETPYKCEVCGDGFRQNVSLRAHRKSKHNIIEPHVCNCKVCGKGFASDSALHAHMRLH